MRRKAPATSEKVWPSVKSSVKAVANTKKARLQHMVKKKVKQSVKKKPVRDTDYAL